MSTQPSYGPRRKPGDVVASTRGQVVRLSAPAGRSAERRIVNLAADMREPGAEMVDVEIADLSTDGFMMRGPIDLEPKALVWLKLPGFAAMRSEVVWVQDGKVGCKFASPLYPADLDLIVSSQPKREVTRLFTPPTAPGQPPARRAA